MLLFNLVPKFDDVRDRQNWRLHSIVERKYVNNSIVD